MPGRREKFKTFRLALKPTQSRIKWEPGIISQGYGGRGREIDRASPISAEVRNVWSCTAPPVYLRGLLMKTFTHSRVQRF